MLRVSKSPWMADEALALPSGAVPVGYAWMVRAFGLNVMPNHRWSFVGKVARQSVVEQDVDVPDAHRRGGRGGGGVDRRSADAARGVTLASFGGREGDTLAA